jgi:hypothetical protein
MGILPPFSRVPSAGADNGPGAEPGNPWVETSAGAASPASAGTRAEDTPGAGSTSDVSADANDGAAAPPLRQPQPPADPQGPLKSCKAAAAAGAAGPGAAPAPAPAAGGRGGACAAAKGWLQLLSILLHLAVILALMAYEAYVSGQFNGRRGLPCSQASAGGGAQRLPPHPIIFQMVTRMAHTK